MGVSQRNQILRFLLIGSMTASVVVGCGDGKSGGGRRRQAPNKTVQKNGVADKNAKAQVDKQGNPIADPTKQSGLSEKAKIEAEIAQIEASYQGGSTSSIAADSVGDGTYKLTNVASQIRSQEGSNSMQALANNTVVTKGDEVTLQKSESKEAGILVNQSGGVTSIVVPLQFKVAQPWKPSRDTSDASALLSSTLKSGKLEDTLSADDKTTVAILDLLAQLPTNVTTSGTSARSEVIYQSADKKLDVRLRTMGEKLVVIVTYEKENNVNTAKTGAEASYQFRKFYLTYEKVKETTSQREDQGGGGDVRLNDTPPATGRAGAPGADGADDEDDRVP